MNLSLRSVALLAVALIGVGLALAPALFQMFSRAPEGASMIDEFGPYMTIEQINEFRGYLAVIDAAEIETRGELQVLLEAEQLDDTAYSSAQALNDQWVGIQADMTDLLDTMDENLDNFAAVDALPSFDLFPWFFVIPGVLIAAVALLAWWGGRAGRDSSPLLISLVVLGVGLILAPAVFQMFTRAPKGADMIDDFRPMMTRERVQNVQGYFITIGAAEGQLRNGVLPAAADATGQSTEDMAAALPDLAVFAVEWPGIVTDFAPMIAAMSDNVDNYEAVDALPSFDLFPWFFVIPGLLVIALAVLAARSPVEAPAATNSPTSNEGSDP